MIGSTAWSNRAPKQLVKTMSCQRWEFFFFYIGKEERGSGSVLVMMLCPWNIVLEESFIASQVWRTKGGSLVMGVRLMEIPTV